MSVETLVQAIEMWETGIVIRRQRFRRDNPDATEDAIDDMVLAWLTEPRPGDITLLGRHRTIAP